MPAWMDVRVKGWPNKTQIRILLKEGSESGTPLSGDVTLVIRKNNKEVTTRKLGLNGTDLIAKVSNGFWQSPEWNYRYWSNLGFNSIVAQYQDGTDEKERYWSVLPVEKDKGAPVPTSISKIHYTGAVDEHQPVIMTYAITWTILDQYGKPIAGKVTVIFDGTTETVESEADRPGVCFNRAVVDGYDKELLFCVLPPVGEPQLIKLVGPRAKQEPKVKTLIASCDRGTKVADDTMRYQITLWAQDTNGSPVGGKMLTWKTDAAETPVAGATTGDTGLVTHTVDVIGVDTTVDYQAFMRKDGGASNTLTLQGAKSEAKHVYAIEADLDSPHPIGGKFIVVGTTKVDDKLRTCECIVSSSPDDVSVEARLGTITPVVGSNTFTLKSSGGNFRLAVPAASITSEYVELVITALDGTSASVPLVKPRR